jgi:hypothetical protein
MPIITKTITVTTTGSDGSAVGSGQTDLPVNGLLLAVHVDFSSGQAATADVTIATKNAPIRTLLTLTSTATDVWVDPRVQAKDNAGAAIDATYTYMPVADHITVDVAQADNNETVTVTLFIAT